jgi:hypothetical protein
MKGMNSLHNSINLIFVTPSYKNRLNLSFPSLPKSSTIAFLQTSKIDSIILHQSINPPPDNKSRFAEIRRKHVKHALQPRPPAQVRKIQRSESHLPGSRIQRPPSDRVRAVPSFGRGFRWRFSGPPPLPLPKAPE